MGLKFDPTISLGHLISAIGMVVVGIGAYYDLKTDVQVNKTVDNSRWERQKIIDANQDERLTDIKTTVQTSTDEIKKKLDWMSNRDLKR